MRFTPASWIFSAVSTAGVRPPGSLARWAPVILRLIVGYGFTEHGYAKIARGPEHFAVILTAIGVPEPRVMSWLTILVEVVGGVAVLLGVGVPASGAHFGPPGYETDLLYLSCLAALALGGSGALSLEQWLPRVRVPRVRGARI